jgi:hypothetical protein
VPRSTAMSRPMNDKLLAMGRGRLPVENVRTVLRASVQP